MFLSGANVNFFKILTNVLIYTNITPEVFERYVNSATHSGVNSCMELKMNGVLAEMDIHIVEN